MKGKLKSSSGFTLIEVMIAMSLFGAVFGSIGYLLISAMDTRGDAIILHRSTLLAKKQMNKIKQVLKETSEEQKIEGFPNYRYHYEIQKKEIDLLNYASLQDEQENNSFSVRSNEAENRESVTGGIIKVLHYQVTIQHKSNLKYTLNYYRILKK